MNKRRTVIKVLLCIAVIALIVVIIFITGKIQKDLIVTSNVNIQTVSQSIYTDSYIVRNETVIESKTDGYVSYVFDNGGKIEVGGVVANIYKTEQDAINNKEIQKIDEKIKNYKKLNLTALTVTTGLDTINNKLNDEIISINKTVNKSKLYKIEKEKEDLLFYINERAVVIGDVINYNEKINQLEAEKKKLVKESEKPIDVIKSPVAGYFTPMVDGYENDYNYKKIEDINKKSLEKLIKSKPYEISENQIGKVISELNWYINCPITKEDAIEIKNANYGNVKLFMPYATSSELPVKVKKINQKNDKSEAVLVLECKYMSDEIANLRKESVQIDLQDYTGFAISKDALHQEVITRTVYDEKGYEKEETKEVMGVFVIDGNILEFKEVDILYGINDIYVCDTGKDLSKFFREETISLYDQVVVEGYDLYEGKFVKR